jgi:hypothetical protein
MCGCNRGAFYSDNDVNAYGPNDTFLEEAAKAVNSV